MYKLVRIISILTAIVFFSMFVVVCLYSKNGDKKETISTLSNSTILNSKSKSKSLSSKSQQQINEEIVKNAEEAKFVNISGHESQFFGKPYYIEGEVISIHNTYKGMPSFTVGSRQNNKFVKFKVLNIFNSNIEEGERMKVYGMCTGNIDGTDIPEITGNVITKKQ